MLICVIYVPRGRAIVDHSQERMRLILCSNLKELETKWDTNSKKRKCFNIYNKYTR